AALGAGAIASVLLLSRLLEHLLENAPEPTYGFFFGLIAVSIVMPWSLLGRKSWPELVSGAIGIALIVGLGMAMSPEDRVDARRTAHEIRSASANPTSASPSSTPDGSARGEESPISSGDASARSEETVPASRTPTTTSRVYEAARFAIAGAIGIAAMILPGLSGSFVLLLLGVYFDVLRAINSWNFPLLFAFAFGCAVGGLLFVRFLSFLIARYRDPTLAFITGLLVGSLWELWPFAKMIAVGDDLLRGEKYLPRIDDATTWITLGAAVLGATILLLSIAWERRMRLARATKDNEASPPAPEAPSPAS
ncbi:MAG TPA: DUF368 domain-containing protein, partial [Planctomycetota bacterium]|nr:DUF368 domain-containing protein [Planctomycetota bacterium]